MHSKPDGTPAQHAKCSLFLKELYQAWRSMANTLTAVDFFYTAVEGLPTAIRAKLLSKKSKVLVNQDTSYHRY